MVNNNDALIYLIVTRMKATVRSFFRKPIHAILSGVVVLAIFGLFYFVSTRESIVPDSFIAQVGFMLMIGAMPLLMLLIFVFNKRTALVYLNDANFLFGGPFSKRQIKNYLVVMSVQQMVTLGVGATIYFGLFFNYLILDFLMIFKAMIFLSLAILLSLMYFNYYYLVNASNEVPTKINTWLPVVSIGMLLIVLVRGNWGVFNGGIPELFENTVSHPWFQWVPFLGWANAVQNNSLLIGYGIPLLLSIVFIVLFYRFEGDFYEKATEDAIVATTTKSKLSESKNNQETLDGLKDSKKVSTIKKFSFFSGGWSIFSRQFLQMLKTKQLLSMNQLMILGIYTFISLFSGMSEMFKSMMVVSILFTINMDSLVMELNKPFIYLIPDSDFKKTIAAIGVKLIQCLFYVMFAAIVLMIAFKEPVASSIYFSVNLLVVSFVYLSILLLSMRFIGLSKNLLLKGLVTIGLYIVSLVPTILVAGILFLTNNFSLETMTILSLLLNTVLGFVFLYFGSRIVSGRGIVD